jgi:hypothetical protein
MEDGARRPQGLVEAAGQDREHRVGLRRPGKAHARHGPEAVREPHRHRIGVAGVGEPVVVREVGLELGCEESALREEVAAAHAPLGQVRRPLAVEDQDGLRGHAAVLGGAEGEDVDPGLPGHGGRRDPEPGRSVGEARAVHVDAQALPARGVGEGRDLLHGVDGADFRRLRQRQRRRLDVMRSAPRDGQERLKVGGGDLAPLSGQAHQLRAARVELGRAALVLHDVRGLVADDAPPGRRERGEGESVRGRAGGDEKDGQVALEHLPEARLHPGRDVVPAVGRSRAAVGAKKGVENGRARAGPVVAGEDHGRSLGERCGKVPACRAGARRLGTDDRSPCCRLRRGTARKLARPSRDPLVRHKDFCHRRHGRTAMLSHLPIESASSRQQLGPVHGDPRFETTCLRVDRARRLS